MDIRFYAKRSAHYYNKYRLEGPRLKGGDKVYLSCKNIKTTRPSDKLDYKKVRPFEIEEAIEEVNYRLKLPQHMRINPVFHISLLEPTTNDAPTIALELSDEQELIEYEVERIVNIKLDQGQRLYRVRWKGYEEQDDTWELEENMSNARGLIQQFQRQSTKTRQQKTRP